VRRDEILDVRAAVTNARANSDKWTATAVLPFAIKRPQAAPEKSSRFRGRQKNV
jgi:hypothetical protein